MDLSLHSNVQQCSDLCACTLVEANQSLLCIFWQDRACRPPRPFNVKYGSGPGSALFNIYNGGLFMVFASAKCRCQTLYNAFLFWTFPIHAYISVLDRCYFQIIFFQMQLQAKRAWESLHLCGVRRDRSGLRILQTSNGGKSMLCSEWRAEGE